MKSKKEEKKTKKSVSKRSVVMFTKNGGKKLYYGKGNFQFKSVTDEVRKFATEAAALKLLDFVDGGSTKKSTCSGKSVLTEEV
jgi:hypothetical protein